MFARIKKFFRKKYIVTIHFKSGIVVQRRAYDFTVNKSGNELTKVTHEWVDDSMLYIHLDSVEMITYK